MSNEIRTRPLTPTEQKYTYAQSMQPVSYTHLDVYKRQVFG